MSQKGFAPILLILLAAAGIIAYLLVTNTFSFKDRLFSQLFPKPTSKAQQSQSVPGEILIKFKPGVPDEAKEKIRDSHALQRINSIPQIEVEKMKVPEDRRNQVIETLNKNPLVEFAEPNFLRQATVIPNDPLYPNQWHLPRTTAPSGWDISTGSQSVIIAILDTGIDTDHEDLVSKIIGTPAEDDNGHGSLVSGIAAAATNNAKGVAGVCWSCSILSIKVLDSSGGGSDFDIAIGMTAAADQGAKVINMSLGGLAAGSQIMQDAANYAWNKGVVLVAASGNDGLNQPFYPAALDNVVAVGGSTQFDSWSPISNYGPWLDVVAPVFDIYTTSMGGGYTMGLGTSLSSPQVAGLAGLIFSASLTLTNQQVVDIILQSADDLTTTIGRDDLTGWGKINMGRALQQTTSTTGFLPDVTAPQASITSPANGSTISGVIDVAANVIDNVGVTRVEFYYQDRKDYQVYTLGTDTVSPYQVSWDTTKVADGRYGLFVKPFDAAGNEGSSDAQNFTANVLNATPTPTPTPVPTPVPKPLSCENYGDVDNDKKITNLDDQEILKIVAGYPNYTVEQKFVADVNDDRTVTASDSISVQRYIAGLDSTLPVCKKAKLSPCPNKGIGDVTEDGKVTPMDSQEVLRIVAGYANSIYTGTSYTFKQRRRADVNASGSVTATDSLLILRYLAGYISTFLACSKTTP